LDVAHALLRAASRLISTLFAVRQMEGGALESG
jgi:hypothetical protein